MWLFWKPIGPPYQWLSNWSCHSLAMGLLPYMVKLRVAHAPGMPGTFSPQPTSKEIASYRSRHASRHVRDARAVMHVGINNQRWWGKRSRHSRRMRNPQFCVSGKRQISHQYVKWLSGDFDYNAVISFFCDFRWGNLPFIYYSEF